MLKKTSEACLNEARLDEAGFNLLEVMIAIAILAVSLLALFHFQSSSLLSSARAQRISVSTLLADQKMSEILLELEKGIKKGEFPGDKEETGNFEGEEFEDYRWKVAIKKVEIPVPPAKEGASNVMGMVFSQVAEQLSKMSREVKVTISWMEFDEEVEGMSLVTHIVNPKEGL